jgi:hypothetical protein
MRIDTISEQATRSAITPAGEHGGAFRARIGGYVVDMVIFAAVAMLTFVLAGAIILVATQNVTDDATNSDIYTFVAIIALGTPVIWTLLNVSLLVLRGQTGGQYVAGVRLEGEDGQRARLKSVLAWWFCLNPLLYSWPMALVAGAPLTALLFLVLNVFALFVLALVVLVCVAAPIVAFASAMANGENRALHDRVAGIVVSPVVR